jgi:DNA topoisomerase VI subunit A
MDNWDEIEVYGKRILVVEKETIYFRLLEEGNEDFLSNNSLFL